MKIYTPEALQEILKAHAAWLKDPSEGVKADLTWADLSGADLSGAKDAFQFGPMPTSGRICVAIRHPEGWKVKAGCFFDYLPVLEKRVKESHNCPVYLGMIEVLKKL